MTNRTRSTISRLFAGLLVCTILVPTLSSCGNDNNSSAPLDDFQPEVNNITDTFQLQATDVVDVTSTLNYRWDNTGTGANVDQSTVPTAGTAILTIFDDAGTQVYTRDLSENGSFACASGMTGRWRIRLQLTNFDGNLNFRVQKP
jgi:hypothetical protein